MATKENQKEAEEGGTPRDDAEEASADESRPEEDASEAEEKGSEEETGEDESAPAAGTLGATRYVMTGFFLAMIAGAYVLGRTLGAIWGKLAEAIWFQKSLAALARVGEEERSEISVAIGAAVALGVGVHLYRRPDVRQWTDEVASEMSKVTWPDKSEVTNSTIIVIVTSAFATLYLALLDRFWGFVTNLVYGS
jgi:preprotein translocase subunit SecE